MNSIIVEAITDIIYNSYIQALYVWELEKRGEKKKSRTRIVNLYDNHFWTDQA